MTFRFSVGQEVEYTPIGAKKAGLYKITRQMPKEEQAIDLRYRIKSDAEAFERNVLECQLRSDVDAASEYTPTKARHPRHNRILLIGRLGYIQTYYALTDGCHHG